MADGSLAKKREKIQFHTKCELCHKMAKHYNNTICNLANQRYKHDDHCFEGKKYICPDHDDHRGHNHHYQRDNKDRKSLPKRTNKAFKSCHLHGPKSQHTVKKCFKHPKNQDKKSYSYDKKCAHKTHHNKEHHASKDKESLASVNLPAPSDSHTLPSEDRQHNKD